MPYKARWRQCSGRASRVSAAAGIKHHLRDRTHAVSQPPSSWDFAPLCGLPVRPARSAVSAGKAIRFLGRATSSTSPAKEDAAALKEEEAAAEAKAKEKAKLPPTPRRQAEEARAKAKPRAEKLAAKAKADEKKKLAAKAKATPKQKLAKAKAARCEDRQGQGRRARKARGRRRSASSRKAKAAEERKIAKAKAAPKSAELLRKPRPRPRPSSGSQAARRRRALPAALPPPRRRQAEIVRLPPWMSPRPATMANCAAKSRKTPKPAGFFAGAVRRHARPEQSMLPETRALDAVLEQKEAKKKFKVKSEFEPQEVQFSGYPRGHDRHRYALRASSISSNRLVRPAATPSRSAARACSSRARSTSATSRNGRAGSRR